MGSPLGDLGALRAWELVAITSLLFSSFPNSYLRVIVDLIAIPLQFITHITLLYPFYHYFVH